MLYLDGDVVCVVRKLSIKRFDQRNGMAWTVEKIRVTKGDVLGSSLNLLTNVSQHYFWLYNEKTASVYWNYRAMTAKMLAAT